MNSLIATCSASEEPDRWQNRCLQRRCFRLDERPEVLPNQLQQHDRALDEKRVAHSLPEERHFLQRRCESRDVIAWLGLGHSRFERSELLGWVGLGLGLGLG